MQKPNSMDRVSCFLLLMLIFKGLIACQNSDKEIKPFADQITLGVEKGKNVTITYSDSGLIIATIRADSVFKFNEEPAKTSLEGNVIAYFFDGLGKASSILTANKAVRYEQTKEIEAIGDVVLVNELNDTLTTQKLNWNERANRIYTEEFVKIKTKDELIYGDGLESNQQFTKYKILNPKGITSLKN